MVILLLTVLAVVVWLVMLETSGDDTAIIRPMEACPSCLEKLDTAWTRCPYCFTVLSIDCAHCGRKKRCTHPYCPHCGARGEGG